MTSSFCFVPWTGFSSAPMEAATQCLGMTPTNHQPTFLSGLREFSDFSGHPDRYPQKGAVIKTSCRTTDPESTRPQNFSRSLPFQKNTTTARQVAKDESHHVLFAICQVQGVTILSTAGFVHLRPCFRFRQVVNMVDKSQAGVHGFSFFPSSVRFLNHKNAVKGNIRHEDLHEKMWFCDHGSLILDAVFPTRHVTRAKQSHAGGRCEIQIVHYL